MDGIAAIESRITDIEARFAPLAPRPLSAPMTSTNALATPATGTVGTPNRLGTLAGAGSYGTAAAPVAGPSFDALFASALGTSGATTPAQRLAPGAYGRLEPPAELVAYGNGRVPAAALSPIGVGDHRLHAPAAHAFRQLLAAAEADGVQIGITDSYRDLATQERLARQKGLYSQGGLAATPGTSNHGWGLAVDLDLDGSAQAWMRANGPRFGFVEDVPREPWHWTYRPA